MSSAVMVHHEMTNLDTFLFLFLTFQQAPLWLWYEHHINNNTTVYLLECLAYRCS